MEWLLYALAAALILLGVVGTVMPGIPGIPLVFAGMVLAAAVESFRLVSLWTLGVLALLTALSIVIEYLAAALGVRRVGASAWAMAGAVLGGLILGVMELVLGAYASTAFIDISAYVVVIAVLLLRPDGLFGRQVVVRV